MSKTTSALNLNHLALSVKNLETSIGFYKELFGLQEITNRTKIEGVQWLSLGEGKELHLISILKDPVAVNKAVHLAFKTPDFDAFFTKIQNMKLEYSDWPGNAVKINIRADGVKQIYFQDPDDYWLEVNSVGDVQET